MPDEELSDGLFGFLPDFCVKNRIRTRCDYKGV